MRTKSLITAAVLSVVLMRKIEKGLINPETIVIKKNTCTNGMSLAITINYDLCYVDLPTSGVVQPQHIENHLSVT